NIWSGSGAHGTPNQQFVGFKTCQKFPAPSPNDCGAAVLTAEQVAAEYSDRNYILNRVYNIAEETFENDSASSIWNLSALEEEFGANASQSLPQKTFDPTSAKVVWDLASAWKDDNDKTSIQSSTQKGILKGAVDGSDDYTVKMYIDANVNGQGGKFESRAAKSDNPQNDTQINAGTVLTVPVTNGAIVSVTRNSGTFGIEGTETITYTHSGAATGIVIYCTANGYLTEVAVSKLNLDALSVELKNATKTGEVRAIKIGDTSKEIMNGNTYKLAVTQYTSYGANAGTVSWTSNNESVATISNDGVVTAKASSGTAKITATVNGHSATCTITAIQKTEVSKYTFDFRIDAANPITISANEDSSKSVSISSGTAKIHGSTYGAVTNGASVIKVPVFANCTITVYQSYKANTNSTLSIANATPTSVTFDTTCDNKGDAALESNKYVFTYSGSAGTADLTFSTGSMYFAKIVVEKN
ncbi:MAG: Ig-like domain-containing protein, partial [Treponemataceae bacterium]|nr:Ig-like domain-containing protein [Treponemataceae bacterium]